MIFTCTHFLLSFCQFTFILWEKGLQILKDGCGLGLLFIWYRDILDVENLVEENPFFISAMEKLITEYW